MSGGATCSWRADPTIPAFADDKPLVIFDGHCGLCSRTAQFILRHDHEGVFRLLAAQTALGTAIYRHLGLNAEDYETFIVLKDGRAYFASEASLELFRALGPPWSLLWLARFVPRIARDGMYFWIARNRMRVFGRSETCYLPAPEHRSRFLGIESYGETR
jgi:predicted DCC family thiol-disulfide oxidoreductase YuxK